MFPRVLLFSVACIISATALPGQVELKRLPDRVRVEIDGSLFTEYIFKGADRPYCYPVLATDNTPLTRDFPMKANTGDDDDHPHHRSVWLAHSRVNGIDFWNEGKSGGDTPKGKIVHDALLETAGGPVGRLRARDRWVAPDGTVFCTVDSTLSFRTAPLGRMLDYEITFHAPANAPIHIGDNKDGFMAIRIAQWMTMPHKLDKKGATERNTGGEGHIVTSQGDRDNAAWGKRGAWCDYHAARNGKTYGIALFDHPQNLRHPTWWMARGYGLFAANPFGWHDYEPKTTPPQAGDHTVPAKGSLTLRYRLYFHFGDEKEAQVAERYLEYAREQPVSTGQIR